MDTPAAEVPASRSSANVDRSAATTRPSGSNVTWLFDLPSIANEEQEWTVGEAQVKGVRYDKSLSVGPGCNSARRDYVISGRHDEFAAMVGMSDLSPETFEIDFYIIADGVTVKTINNVKIAAPQKVAISVKGVTRLTLGVEPPVGGCPLVTGVWIDPALTSSSD
jgi:hypothetical protein